MKRMRSRRIVVLTILIPPILATCICMAYFVPQFVCFFNSTFLTDYVWSVRVIRELTKEGYLVHDVRVRESDALNFKDIHIQVGNLVKGEQRRTFELVKSVHEVVIETFEVSSSQPSAVDVIVITLVDYSSGSYFISVDFDTARRYYRGEISEETYFSQWSYDENTPGITPP